MQNYFTNTLANYLTAVWSSSSEPFYIHKRHQSSEKMKIFERSSGNFVGKIVCVLKPQNYYFQ